MSHVLRKTLDMQICTPSRLPTLRASISSLAFECTVYQLHIGYGGFSLKCCFACGYCYRPSLSPSPLPCHLSYSHTESTVTLPLFPSPLSLSPLDPLLSLLLPCREHSHPPLTHFHPSYSRTESTVTLPLSPLDPLSSLLLPYREHSHPPPSPPLTHFHPSYSRTESTVTLPPLPP